MFILSDLNREDNLLSVLDAVLLPKDVFPIVVYGFQLY